MLEDCAENDSHGQCGCLFVIVTTSSTLNPVNSV